MMQYIVLIILLFLGYMIFDLVRTYFNYRTEIRILEVSAQIEFDKMHRKHQLPEKKE